MIADLMGFDPARDRCSHTLMENSLRPSDVLDTNLMAETIAEPDFTRTTVTKVSLSKPQGVLIETVTETTTFEASVVFPLQPEAREASTNTSEVNSNPHSSTTVLDEVYQPKQDEAVDDETTLEEEERGATADDGELDELERLGEMPLEELLKMYGGGAEYPAGPSVEENSGTSVVSRSEPNGEQPSSSSTLVDTEQPGPSHSSSSSTGEPCLPDDDDWSSTDGEDEEGDEVGEGKSGDGMEFLRLLSQIGKQSGEAESDGSSDDDEEFVPFHLLMIKRETPIGPEHQVKTPDVPAGYPDEVVDFEDEVLMWAPRVSESRTLDFLKAAYLQERELLHKEIDPEQLSQADVADDEEFLKEFLSCNFDQTEALRRCRRNFQPGEYDTSKWSEKECEAFESAIVDNWKRFNIVQTSVPTRTVKELVDFYYRWKKSPRFQVFLAKIKTLEGKPHDHLEEKIKVRVGKKRAFDAMDAVSEDQLAGLESSSSSEPRSKEIKVEVTREKTIVVDQAGTSTSSTETVTVKMPL